MNVDTIPAWVEAMATIVLVIVTATYIWQLNKQKTERDRRELFYGFYLPLLRNLKEIIKKPESLAEVQRRPSFISEKLKMETLYVIYLVPRDLLRRVEIFYTDYKRYQDTFGFIWEEIELLINEVACKEFNIPVNRMREIYFLVRPTNPEIRPPWRNMPQKDFYSLVFEEISPRDWFERVRKGLGYPVRLEVSSAYADPLLKDVISVENSFSLYESVRLRIGNNESLLEFFNLQRELLREAQELIDEIERLQQNQQRQILRAADRRLKPAV